MTKIPKRPDDPVADSVEALLGCAAHGNSVFACTEVTARLQAAERAEAEGPGHQACAAALRHTAARIAYAHLTDAQGQRDEQRRGRR